MKKSQALMSSGSLSDYAQVESPPMDSPCRDERSDHEVVRSKDEHLLHTPPPGDWRDGICSWSNNLWPSCFCSFFVCCGGWIAGQIAQASGYQAFQSFVAPYIVAFAVFTFIFVVTQNIICVIILWIIVYIYAIFLRLHFVKKHEITQNGRAKEMVIALFCCPCSLAQMARHTFGYRLVFDGDSKPDPPIYYTRANEDIETQVRELELTEHETEILGRASHEV